MVPCSPAKSYLHRYIDDVSTLHMSEAVGVVGDGKGE